MKKLFTGMFLCLTLFSLSGQKMPDLTAPIPTDENCRIGVLENGLKYYIRKNTTPKKKVIMQLAVNAGSINETEDQKGLAHFTEHMLFNGTKNFPKNALVDFLQKTGMRFGGDINASTNFDETIYTLDIPSEKEELLEKAFLVLEDWAHQASMDPDEIEKERGVIIAEWRSGLGAGDRMRKQALPVIFNQSLYAQRLPIGTLESLQTFKPSSLQKFYKDFYRPDLQAVIVVGDIDPAYAEAKIKEHFSKIKSPKNAPERKYVQVPDNEKPLVVITKDKELSYNFVSIMYKHAAKTPKTIGDYREMLMSVFASEMLNARFGELSMEEDAPFVHASESYSRFVRSIDILEMTAVSKENKIAESFAFLLRECKRVDEFGFLETEFERAKLGLASLFEKAANEYDKTHSSAISDEYVRHFLEGSPIPGAKKELEYFKALSSGITVEEVNTWMRQAISDKNRVVWVSGIDKEGLKIPSEEEVFSILNDAKNLQVQAYVDTYMEKPLVEVVPKKFSGQPDKLSVDKVHGITSVVLSNGIRVRLKPTDFKNDQILLSAYNEGGISLLSNEDASVAELIPAIMNECGLGEFDNIELSKKLKGRDVNYATSLDETQAALSGSSSVKDFETLLQLNYLNFTAPRKDEKAFNSFMSKMKGQIKFLSNMPMLVFMDTLMKLSTNQHPRVSIIPTMEAMNALSMEKTYDLYKECFGNPGSFNYYLVGNFEINESFLDLLETYLGTLPAEGQVRTWKNHHIHFPAQTKDVAIYKGSEEQSTVAIILSEEIEWTPETRMNLSFIKGIIENKLIEVIREQMGGVYSPSVSLDIERYPEPKYILMLTFMCDPKDVDTLCQAVFSEVEKLRKEGAAEEDILKIREMIRQTHESNIGKNTYWLDLMGDCDFLKDDITTQSMPVLGKRLFSVKKKSLKKAAEKLIQPSHYIRLVMYPDPAEMEE